MLFISEKQITGFHRQLFECIHVFSSGISLIFPCQCELAPDTVTAKVSVCVFVCMCTCVRKVTTVICIMGFVVPKADVD